MTMQAQPPGGARLRQVAHQLLNEQECFCMKTAIRTFRDSKDPGQLVEDIRPLILDRHRLVLPVEMGYMMPDYMRQEFYRVCLSLWPDIRNYLHNPVTYTYSGGYTQVRSNYGYVQNNRSASCDREGPVYAPPNGGYTPCSKRSMSLQRNDNRNDCYETYASNAAHYAHPPAGAVVCQTRGRSSSRNSGHYSQAVNLLASPEGRAVRVGRHDSLCSNSSYVSNGIRGVVVTESDDYAYQKRSNGDGDAAVRRSRDDSSHRISRNSDTSRRRKHDDGSRKHRHSRSRSKHKSKSSDKNKVARSKSAQSVTFDDEQHSRRSQTNSPSPSLSPPPSPPPPSPPPPSPQTSTNPSSLSQNNNVHHSPPPPPPPPLPTNSNQPTTQRSSGPPPPAAPPPPPPPKLQAPPASTTKPVENADVTIEEQIKHTANSLKSVGFAANERCGAVPKNGHGNMAIIDELKQKLTLRSRRFSFAESESIDAKWPQTNQEENHISNATACSTNTIRRMSQESERLPGHDDTKRAINRGQVMQRISCTETDEHPSVQRVGYANADSPQGQAYTDTCSTTIKADVAHSSQMRHETVKESAPKFEVRGISANPFANSILRSVVHSQPQSRVSAAQKPLPPPPLPPPSPSDKQVAENRSRSNSSGISSGTSSSPASPTSHGNRRRESVSSHPSSGSASESETVRCRQVSYCSGNKLLLLPFTTHYLLL